MIAYSFKVRANEKNEIWRNGFRGEVNSAFMVMAIQLKADSCPVHISAIRSRFCFIREKLIGTVRPGTLVTIDLRALGSLQIKSEEDTIVQCSLLNNY